MRRRKDPIQAVCELDAFPKVADTYKQTSTTGGTSTALNFFLHFGTSYYLNIVNDLFAVSLVCVLLILSLVYSEIRDFVYSGVKFHFTPDDELESKMDLNVDMTVAMPCRCNKNKKIQ